MTMQSPPPLESIVSYQGYLFVMAEQEFYVPRTGMLAGTAHLVSIQRAHGVTVHWPCPGLRLWHPSRPTATMLGQLLRKPRLRYALCEGADNNYRVLRRMAAQGLVIINNAKVTINPRFASHVRATLWRRARP